MPKKRTTLDSLFRDEEPHSEPLPENSPPTKSAARKREGFKHQTVYLPLAVHEQLRKLAFEERARMHDYLMEGLDKVFASRGLPSLRELVPDGEASANSADEE